MGTQYGGMGYGGFGGYGLTGMADLGFGSGYGMMGSSTMGGQDLHEAAAADPGVVVKTPQKKGKTRSVRNYGASKPKYCGCC
jgi:hypothetical protein